MMKRIALSAVVCLAVSIPALAAGKKGEALFKQHCAVCHPDGGNIVNAKKGLRKKSLEANGVKSAKDVIAKLRNPGPGMTKFDEKTVPAKDAQELAEYVLKTFK